MLFRKSNAIAILVAASLMNTTWASDYLAPPQSHRPAQPLHVPLSPQQQQQLQLIQAEQQSQIQRMQLASQPGQFRPAGNVRQLPPAQPAPSPAARPVSYGHPGAVPVNAVAVHQPGVDPESGYVNQGQYPQLNAPLYPSPVQYTTPWTGGTVITNQAFAPHEMLYPHTYHAMYPPFYHKVKGSWVVTPFGVRQHEHWKLQGTEVTVKYRSSYPLFSNFVPPRVD